MRPEETTVPEFVPIKVDLWVASADTTLTLHLLKTWKHFLKKRKKFHFEDAVAELPGVISEIRRSARIADKQQTKMVSLTTEQFKQLLETVNRPNARPGSMSNCTARFNGERVPSKVEEFISTVSTFKQRLKVEHVTDENAINGMPILLEGDAAEWWRGVKSNAATFADVVRMIRESFSPPKPAWRVFAEISEHKQQLNEPTDSFIRKKRALFATLEDKPLESMQIDMVFGLLHSQIRERVLRHKIQSFDELLKEAREAELVCAERKSENQQRKPIETPNTEMKLKCSFCRRKGHIEEECFRKKEAVAKAPPKIDVVTVKPKYSCYGCGAMVLNAQNQELAMVPQ